MTFSFFGKVNFHQTASGATSYSFTDAGILNTIPLQATLYYRLKMVDIDGRAEYSKIVAVALNEQRTALISAYPDPFINEIFLKTAITNAGNVRVSLMDARGRVVRSIRTFLTSGENTIIKCFLAARNYLKTS